MYDMYSPVITCNLNENGMNFNEIALFRWIMFADLQTISCLRKNKARAQQGRLFLFISSKLVVRAFTKSSYKNNQISLFNQNIPTAMNDTSCPISNFVASLKTYDDVGLEHSARIIIDFDVKTF